MRANRPLQGNLALSNAIMTIATRDYSLDAARGVLMMLGIVLHASEVYSVGGHWIVADPRNSLAFNALASAIHVFRMPAFFWIAGYFVAFTFERTGSAGLLRHRLTRLGVPLATTWLTLNVAQEGLVAVYRGVSPLAAVRDGVPVSHLWFLIDLLLLILVAAPLLPRMARASSFLAGHFPRRLPGQVLVLAVATYLVVLLARATGIAYASPLELTSVYRLATYGPYFAVGILMYRLADIRAAFLRAPPALLLVAVPLALFDELRQPDEGRLLYEAAQFLSLLGTWMSVAAVLSLFRRAFPGESSLTRFVSEASYSIYLFHHVLVIALGMALIPSSLPLPVKFLAVCATTLLVTASLHVAVVRRIPVVRFLFNGKR